jgi:hypothetical protein
MRCFLSSEKVEKHASRRRRLKNAIYLFCCSYKDPYRFVNRFTLYDFEKVFKGRPAACPGSS